MWHLPDDDTEPVITAREIDVKTKCIGESRQQIQFAERIGTSPSYVNKIAWNKERSLIRLSSL